VLKDKVQLIEILFMSHGIAQSVFHVRINVKLPQKNHIQWP